MRKDREERGIEDWRKKERRTERKGEGHKKESKGGGGFKESKVKKGR